MRGYNDVVCPSILLRRNTLQQLECQYISRLLPGFERTAHTRTTARELSKLCRDQRSVTSRILANATKSQYAGSLRFLGESMGDMEREKPHVLCPLSSPTVMLSNSELVKLRFRSQPTEARVLTTYLRNYLNSNPRCYTQLRASRRHNPKILKHNVVLFDDKC